MGVPKFFRYISERYPNLSELVGSKELPQFDNMYLDMNGIIHVCSHPDDSNVHFRITEEQIFRDIFHYIDTLFRLIQPQKLFFMAVDGVAPRAKMNQQRGRRFRSAKEATDLIEKAKQKGETLPTESRFDSNCITPGTAFMARLQDALKHFVKTKLTTDASWQKCRFILSGHETPGEGEHKIMEYIRYLKSKSDYDPNTRHCLYGLDADLMMLGLCTHELQFSLLREEVKFGKKAKRASSVDETRFYLLHLGLLREYLELEFSAIRDKVSFGYDIEHIIDDWIFMCFMVGNDFIPHLPNLHISSNALPILYKAYMEVLPKLDGYINEAGKLNLPRLEVFMAKLSEVDRNLFKEHYEDLKLFHTGCDNTETFGGDLDEIYSSDAMADLAALVKNTMLDYGSSTEGSISESDNENVESDFVPDELDESGDDLDDDELFEKEFRLHKRNYYITKMNYPEMTNQVLAEQTECYITALQWTLSYYYRGVCSWGWYYPHHYAPYISDVKNFKNLNIKLDMGRPFLPFQQLLAVLPAASREHLPCAYHKLMTQATSKVIDYYPADFATDLNGKKQDWEAVVLIPFIDEIRLIDAMDDCESELTDGERARNIHGPMLQYDYCGEDQGSLPDSPFGQAGVAHLLCIETPIERNDIQVAENRLVLGPCKASLTNVYFPGFPTMRHLKHSATLRMERVKVFEQPSRNESMIIRIDEKRPELSTEELANLYLGKEVYIGWPHLREAKVIAVSDDKIRIFKNENEVTTTTSASFEFNLHLKQLQDHHLIRMGIELGEITHLFHVYPLLNREYVHSSDGKLTLEKNWSKISLAVAPLTIVENINVHKRSLAEYQPIENVFTKESTVFMMNNVYYGSQGTIIDPVVHNGRLKVSVFVRPQPDFLQARQIHDNEGQMYLNSYNAASCIGMQYKLFNRITGTMLIVTGEKRFPISDSANKTNVGLQFKFPKHNEELVDYTRHKSYQNQWLYSQKAVDLVNAYWTRFPRLFELLNSRSQHNDTIFESELNEGRAEGEESLLREITRWLKEQPHQNAPRRSCGTEALDKDAIAAIVEATNSLKNGPVRSIKLQVKPHLLYKPNLNDITVMPDSSATFELFDRVVIARDGYSVPLGMHGTIISIQPSVDTNPVRQENINAVEYFYDVLFDTPFDGAQTIANLAEKRLFKVRQSVLLNISHGLGQNRNAKNNNTKRAPQHAQSPVQQPNQNWRIKKNADNDNNRIENKEWPALNNGHANDRRNNRDTDKSNKSNYYQSNPQAMRNKFDDGPKREVNWRYGFKQSIPINTPKTVLGAANDGVQNANWRDEQRPPATETSLKNIPLPKQFMELSLLEKQAKSNAEAAAKVNQLRDPSIILQSLSATNVNETVGDSSDVLRKLLRISSQAPSSPSKESRPFDFLLNKSMPPASNSTQFANQIPATMLPKPPSDWTGKEQKPKVQMQNNQHAFPPMHPMPLPFINGAPNGFPPFVQQAPFMPPPPPPFNLPNQMRMCNFPMTNHPAMMRPFMHSNIRIGMRPQIAANFNAFPHQIPPPGPVDQIKQGPIGPQNLSNNSKHLPGHGAFIPLQAIRKAAKPTKNTVAPAKKNAAKLHKRPPLTEQEIHEQINQFKRQITNENAKEGERKFQQEISMNKGPAKPAAADNRNGDVPRPIRLACKFDLPPA